ncbi:MAG: hypothetical protein JNM56_03085 [Planctomycetia bacterium]|nr:hypothetical protein [Planctomycetia bacterium]
MDPWWTDPTAADQPAAAPGRATVTVNTLPDALPRRRKRRRRQDTILIGKPFQEPPFWLGADEPVVASPARPTVEEPPFRFTVPAVPRRRHRPLRMALRLVVPTFISVSCAGLIVALALQALQPVQPKELVQARAPVVEVETAKPPAAKPAAEVVVPAELAVVLAKPQAAEPPAAEVVVAAQPPTVEPVAPAKPPARVDAKPIAADCAVCKEPGAGDKAGDYGTSIRFVENSQTASEAAREQQKLMLVLNISGNFEDSGFT